MISVSSLNLVTSDATLITVGRQGESSNFSSLEWSFWAMSLSCIASGDHGNHMADMSKTSRNDMCSHIVASRDGYRVSVICSMVSASSPSR